MLHIKIQDGRLDTIEVQGLAEATTAIYTRASMSDIARMIGEDTTVW